MLRVLKLLSSLLCATVHWLKRLGLTVGVVLLVALPRLTHLGGYLIVDEADRWQWAEAFYRALIAGDLRATLVGDGYPGIVPAWIETLWLLGESLRRSILDGGWFGDEGVYLLFHVWSRTAHLAQQRFPIVFFNSLLALLVGWHASKVYGRRVGLVALILIALSPFYLADSRVNRAEAVITGLLTLSILFLVRYGQTGQRRWLIASGIMGGLSFLTKIQGLVVLPAVGIILLLVERNRDREFLPLLLSLSRSLLLWTLAAILIWVILWPAMWVRPLDVLRLVFDYATRKAGSEGVNLFFMGQHFYDQDPGSLFYPVVVLLRMTPLTMLGLVLALWGGIHSLRTAPPPSQGVPSAALQGGFAQGRGGSFRASAQLLDGSAPSSSQGEGRGGGAFARKPVVPLLIYVLLYGGAMTLGSHKQDRYLMPIFLVLDIVAAMGWVYLWDWLSERWNGFRTPRWTLAACGVLTAVQVASVLPYHPYYFSYFNPLMGGATVGAKTLRVGWGEGMDRVADYLNAKPDAPNLTVAARWHPYMLGFAGKTLPFDEGGQWTQADYIVLYIQQTQRMLDPSPGIIRYFQARQPEHVVRINGIDYAQIYPSPFTRPAQPPVSHIPGQAALLGYRWEDAALPRAQVQQLRVIWENQGFTQPAWLMAALTDGDIAPRWQPCQIVPGFEAAAGTPGEVVESACDLSPIADQLAAGAFDLRFGLADSDGDVTAFLFPQGWRSMVKEEDGTWRPAQRFESLDQIARREVSATATMADVYYRGQIRLVAYELSDTVLHPGQPLAITLYWQAILPVEEDYLIFNHLFGLDGTTLGMAEELPSRPTSRWLFGQVITTTHQIRTDTALPAPALATLDIGLYDAEHKSLSTTDRDGQRVPVTLTRLKFIPVAWPSQPPPIADDALFGDSLLLEGHALFEANLTPGSTLKLQLWWQALAPVGTDYTVFVHLLDAAGNIVAQGDSVPVGGRYPTSVWEVGEQIIDPRAITLPAELMPGQYRLIVGLYNPLDGSRLRLSGHETDFLLGQLTVKPELD